MPQDQEDPDDPPADDLIAVIDAFHAMWNTHHLNGLLSFFTDDAVFTMVGNPREAPAIYRGKAAIRGFLRTHLPGWQVYARSHYRTDADRVVWMARVTADWLRRLGVDWIEWKAEAVVRGGKIAAYTVTLTPGSVAKLETAKRGNAGEV